MSFLKTISGKNSSVVAIALFGVLGLGAKGCDRAVVGEDGSSGEGGASGEGGEAGSGQAGTGSSGTSTGGSGWAGTGSSGTTGTAGTTGSVTCGGNVPGSGCPSGQFCDYPPAAICGAADATGVCRTMPEVCTEEYAPVCGCDDQTYGNACFAAAAGVSIVRGGPCEPAGSVCGGLTGEFCAENEFCSYPPDANCGRADAPGVCVVAPQACDTIYDPVCGCDGQTYGNDCEAAMAGVSVETQGECGDPGGESCGGQLGTECAEGSFCNYPIDAMCGAADRTGTCVPTPDGCTLEYNPVCGCDDKTYGNACAAATAGVSVQHTGECEPASAELCGGIATLQCPDGSYCKFPDDPPCGASDATGTCEVKPEVCLDVYDPVCGCDGKTYANDCEAAGAGVSVQAEGECAK